MTDAAEFFASVREHVFGGRLTADQVDGMNAILSAWATHGDGDNRKLAYLLATAKHETADTMQPIHELGKKSYFDKYEPNTKIGKALGNTQPGDGYLFRGRGFCQLTGRRNYEHAGKQLGFNLVAVPEQALNAAVAADILVKGCLEGWFTGRKLGGFINAGETDFINARRVVNGTDRAVLIAGYANKFEDALRGKLPIPANRSPAGGVPIPLPRLPGQTTGPAATGFIPAEPSDAIAPPPARRKTLKDLFTGWLVKKAVTSIFKPSTSKGTSPMFATSAKAFTALVMAALYLANTYLGWHIGLTEETLNTLIAIATPVLVWLIPNKKTA